MVALAVFSVYYMTTHLVSLWGNSHVKYLNYVLLVFAVIAVLAEVFH